MESIDFSQTGGYRLKQPTLAKMQRAYFEVLKAFLGYLQVPDTGNFILYGCEVSGANITSGMMYIDGELCPFTESAGTTATKIKKNTVLEAIAFKSGANLPVLKTVTAVTDPTTGVELQNFNRVNGVPVLDPNLVVDANYVHTDNNFTDALLTPLNSIEFGAEKNVQTDWDVTNPASPAYLKNRPTIVETLKAGTAFIGTIYNWGLGFNEHTINFPSIGTTDYVVFGQLRVGNGVVCHFNISARTATYFKVKITKDAAFSTSTATGVYFDYYILPIT